MDQTYNNFTNYKNNYKPKYSESRTMISLDGNLIKSTFIEKNTVYNENNNLIRAISVFNTNNIKGTVIFFKN
jgi:hypothetical protein